MTAERKPRIGVLALQGAVRQHVEAIRDVGAEPVEVRLPRDLVDLDALILPGGESTTMRRLIDAYNLREPIAAMARANTPMLGTCAGMILLAERDAAADTDPYLAIPDLEIRRNGDGRQLGSFAADLGGRSLSEATLQGVFIRAPVVTDVGARAEVVARDSDGNPVGVRQSGLPAT